MKKSNDIRRYYKHISKKNLFWLYTGIFLLITPLSLSIIYPLLIKNLVNQLFLERSFPGRVLVEIILLYVAIYASTFIGSILRMKSYLRAFLELKSKIFTNFMYIPRSKIKEKGEAFYSRMINEDIEQSLTIFDPVLYYNLFDLLRAVPIIIIVSGIDKLVAVFFLLIFMLALVIFIISQFLLTPKHRQAIKSQGIILSFISESLKANECIKKYNYLKCRSTNFLELSKQLNNKYFDIFKVQLFIENLLTKFPNYTLRILMLFYLCAQILKNNLTYGDFIAITIFHAFIESPSRLISAVSSHFSKIKGNISRINEYFEETNKLISNRELINEHLPFDKNYFLSFHDFSITYNNNIINNFSAQIDLDKKIGLLGLSGIGKTALINSLLGIENSYTGKISIFNESLDIKHYDTTHMINYLSQESYILDLPLKENIIMGNKFDENYYNRILEDMDLKDFRKDNFGSGGSFLSGGEKRKISLARFLYNFIRNDFFIIDEPFISLDEITKDLYLNVLMKYLEGKTGIVISHDFKVILNIVGRSYVIENNNSYTYGDHEELSKNSPFYKNAFTKYLNKMDTCNINQKDNNKLLYSEGG